MEKELSSQLDTLSGLVKNWGVSIPEEKIAQFIFYHKLIVKKNESVSLVSARDLKRIVPRHFLESLALLRIIEFHPALLVMDFGCGAGFPSIPLKILFSDFHLYLVESQRKKALFLQKIVADLELENVTILNDRGEKLHLVPEYREAFDIVLARAVAPLTKIVPWCIPFLSERGKLIIPGAPSKDLPAVEEVNNIWGGYRKVTMIPEGMGMTEARSELEILELRQVKRHQKFTPFNL